MAIDVRLEVESTDLLFQQNPTAKVIVTNVGRETVTVASLADPAVPAFRLVALDTGAESEQRADFGMTGLSYQPLAPRAVIEEEFPLFETLSLPRPGRYEVTALVETEGGATRAESKPLRVIPSTSSTPSMARAMSPKSSGASKRARMTVLMRTATRSAAWSRLAHMPALMARPKS